MTAVESEARRELAAVQKRLIAEAAVDVRPRFIDLEGGPRLQVLEAGDGEPLILLHGSGTSAVTMLPLMEQLHGRRTVAMDRPGYGLSEPIDGLRERPRRTAVGTMVRLLDALDIERVDLVGNSTGAFWSLWVALDRPERVRRVVLLGGTPLLPGTRAPLILRLMTTPGIGAMLERVMPDPSPDTVKKMMATVGEGDTIVNYPGLIDALVAAGRDPVAGRTAREELTGVIRGVLGFRPSFRITETELRSARQPVLLIWGDRDRVGSPDVGRAAADLIPHGRAVVVPTGHTPWLGEPQHTAELIVSFLAEPPSTA